MKEKEIPIWPPYEIFYIESLLTITHSAIASINFCSKQITNINTENRELILDSLQNIISQAAALSRFMWLGKNAKESSRRRGEFIRMSLGITENNPLKNRDVRNSIEHFDEKLDDFISKPIAASIYPSYLGYRLGITEPFYVFRAYYIDEEIFEVLGKKFHLAPIVSEIIRIHGCLLKYRKEGGRFKIPNKITACG